MGGGASAAVSGGGPRIILKPGRVNLTLSTRLRISYVTFVHILYSSYIAFLCSKTIAGGDKIEHKKTITITYKGGNRHVLERLWTALALA
jgi:hypothetical protein